MSSRPLKLLLPSRPLANSIPPVETPVRPHQRPRKRGALQRRNRHTTSEWNQLKKTISQLYVAENKSVDDVVKVLSKDHGFEVSRRKLLEILKDWGLGKKLKREQLKVLLEKKNARLDNEGKDTEFLIHGQPLTIERLDRSIQRSGCSLDSDQESPSTAATPVGITYHTPRASSPESQLWYQDLPHYPATAPEMLVTTRVGALKVVAPRWRTPLFLSKLPVGWYSVTSVGLDQSDEDGRWRIDFMYEIGVYFRTMAQQMRSRPRLPELPTPVTCPATSSFPGCWVKHPQGHYFENVDPISNQLIMSMLWDLLRCVQPEFVEHWNYDLKMVQSKHLSEGHQRTAAQIEAMFPCRKRDGCRLIFVDIFLIPETQPESNNQNPPIIKVSLGEESQPDSQCSSCEKDHLNVFTVDIVTRAGAIAVQVPLPNYNCLGLRLEHTLFLKTTKARGTWKDIGSQLAG